MRWLIAVALALTLGAGSARAATLADVKCAAAKTEWAKVSGGTDVRAMRAAISKIPPGCAVRAAAVQRIANVEAAAAASVRSAAQRQRSRDNAAAAEAAREQAAAAADDAAWAIARAANSVAAYNAYLSAYPSGRHGGEARGARAAAVAVPSTAQRCMPGYVWRMAGPHDQICVTPQTRQQARDDNAAASQRANSVAPITSIKGGRGPAICKEGFVWRKAFTTDYVCVTPQTFHQTQADNAAATSHTH